MPGLAPSIYFASPSVTCGDSCHRILTNGNAISSCVMFSKPLDRSFPNNETDPFVLAFISLAIIHPPFIFSGLF